MYLKSIQIKNYRLLLDVNISLNHSTTLIVGRNNSGKTSLMDFILSVISGKKLSFADYPIYCRDKIYSLFKQYVNREIDFDNLLDNIPKPSITFHVDYSLDTEDKILGNLSPFIIDTDIDTTEAIILATYIVSISEDILNLWLHEIDISNPEETQKEIMSFIKNHFNDMFSLMVLAINPKNPEDYVLKSQNELSALFPIRTIRAERGMDESENQNKSPLRPILGRLFNSNLDELTENIKGEISELKDLISTENSKVQIRANQLLNDIIEKSIHFGYPNAEDLKLHAATNIALTEQIEKNTDLAYVSENSSEELPSTHNGLGYKNLIKIIFELAEFSKVLDIYMESSIPILFLEEPESHMHPQLQQTFVKYLDDFLQDIAKKPVQVIMTTHSSHIVNTVPFEQIRYAKKEKGGVKYRNLSDFCESHKENVDFIRKYLTISRCDLFFADKAILIEGSAERLLIPDMIEKCRSNYKSNSPKLPSQYFALVEVGGAYAHKFCPFIDFLEIPTLILTDIDSDTPLVSKGTKSTNATINWWIKDVCKKGDDCKISLKEIMTLEDEYKTCGYRHVEYQVEEEGICGRSLEEALRNSNRKLYGLQDPCSECEIIFDDGKKTDFAIELLIEKKDYCVPEYIKRGLIWLDEQPVIGVIHNDK